MAQKHVELTTKNEEKEEEIIWKEMQFCVESKEFKEDDKAKDADAAAAADVVDTNDANEAAHASFTFRTKHSCKVSLNWSPKFPEHNYLLFNSVFELEPSVIDALQATFPFPVYSLGSLIPYFNLQYHNSSRPTSPNGVDYLEWLDSSPQSSVLYVSLGSFLSV
ncbi:hypothetical protein RHSIM_Rhsim04G0088300 [Rhododendron simsii]|uniref:Uncharacterized protein n=1 Tax=Rhododendron simsii TaxID=118357 RepID=A0A834H4B7_RHOSS|nr:hypothetical protein RHSIM_Rhsim04G0088300 [Rhododendron simsii]